MYHLNCGWLQAGTNPRASCHCLLLEEQGRLALVDTGIGLRDVQQPLERIGQTLIDIAGFQFAEEHTALRQIEKRGFSAGDVKHIVLSHADPDHAGGLAGFPAADVHVSEEELTSVTQGGAKLPFPRYLPVQFEHGVKWRTHGCSQEKWFGLEARRVDLAMPVEVLLIPLFGHTWGHCGVAVRENSGWLLYAGDAYYLRGELEVAEHPVTGLARHNAVDEAGRLASLDAVRRILREHGGEVRVFGYHDEGELPAGCL